MIKRMTAGSRGFRSVRRRGNVLIEFVAIIPFLGAILGFTFFFGWAMVNQQHVKIADRYQAWRHVRAGSGVGAATLNERIFQGYLDEENYHQNSGTYSSETIKTLQGLVEAAEMQSPQASALADTMVMERSPRGRWTTVYGRFPNEIGIFQQVENYQGSIKHTHMRDGLEWRWRQVWCEPVLRDEFLSDLDSTLEGVPSPGDGLANMAQRLYLSRW
ncbi:MAG: hypothetical protein QGH94_09050 [Phycisphaerae bacterium]|jgi:hypothetical protein|nr:hypothetical protein [Phycisphaerae bacterium]MDP7288126.1 hypothetical protein [Phycisphaerae bacterium]